MTKEPVAHGKMHVNAGSPPGVERDSKGNVIPLAERTPEDQEKARASGESDDGIKNPEQELEHPAAMPRDQQGRGGKVKDSDPEGQQGGVEAQNP